jgi:hypothetical protein
MSRLPAVRFFCKDSNNVSYANFAPLLGPWKSNRTCLQKINFDCTSHVIPIGIIMTALSSMRLSYCNITVCYSKACKLSSVEPNKKSFLFIIDFVFEIIYIYLVIMYRSYTWLSSFSTYSKRNIRCIWFKFTSNWKYYSSITYCC